MSYTALSISEMIENININEMKEKVRRVKRIIIQGVERAHSKVHSLEPAWCFWGAGTPMVYLRAKGRGPRDLVMAGSVEEKDMEPFEGNSLFPSIDMTDICIV